MWSIYVSALKVTWLFDYYCRGDAHARIGSFTRLLHAERCWVESSLLLDECRCHVVSSRPSLCQSIFSWVFHVFLSHAHIRGVPVSDIWYDQNTPFAVAVCDLRRSIFGLFCFSLKTWYLKTVVCDLQTGVPTKSGQSKSVQTKSGQSKSRHSKSGMLVQMPTSDKI